MILIACYTMLIGKKRCCMHRLNPEDCAITTLTNLKDIEWRMEIYPSHFPHGTTEVSSPENASMKIRNLKIIRIVATAGGVVLVLIGFLLWNVAQTEPSVDELIGIILIALGLVDMPLEYVLWTLFINKRIKTAQKSFIAPKLK